eukprot:TRINITY_DN70973_c0_g1_i1.p1 TRINITY_DN70973_c0_g1~~TRINITY_DN70973_c0_g1_i1.p1  ORF type:complete len:316 (-),score=76.92 TRINITY_DN70973_c0_g1_i1:153-1046(-)
MAAMTRVAVSQSWRRTCPAACRIAQTRSVSSSYDAKKTFEAGLEKRRATLGTAYVDKNLAAADNFSRPFQEAMTAWCWGFGWGDAAIQPKERSMMNLAMIGALGEMDEFEVHCRGALTNGVSVEEIRAILHVIAIYAGVPQGVKCFKVARRVLEAEGKLPTAESCKAAGPVVPEEFFAAGLAQRRATLGAEYVDNNLAAADELTRPFQEAMTSWCWGFGWGDATIDPKTRSMMNLAMIGALGKMHEWELHCRGALNNGVSFEELRAIVHVIAIYCGVPQGVECFRSARKVLEAAGKI